MAKKDKTIDLIVKQPISALNKRIEFNYKDLFVDITKIAIATKLGDPVTALSSVMDLLKTAKLEEKPEWLAWMLISKALEQTLFYLVDDYKDLFEKELTEEELEDLATRAAEILETVEVTIDAEFFKQPRNLPLLDDFKSSLVFWLKALGWDNAQAEAFHLRFKSHFVLALNDIWATNPKEYAPLESRIATPFTDASMEQRNRIRYNASLAELGNERVFNEAFSLKQVYVPLNAYYTEIIKDDDDNDKELRTAFDLHEYINNWVNNFDKENALKVISGGPGCGKSSFSKMLTAEVAEQQNIPVLFIPLHQFDPSKDLISAVEDFISYKKFSVGNPLDVKTGQERLLLIFDGLDELSMKSKSASDVADEFVQMVDTALHRFNTEGLKRQAIITGRDIAVQGSQQRLRKPQQTLHMLPYYLNKKEQKKYEGHKLDNDLRNTWWQKFGKAKGIKKYKKLPDALTKETLTPITREPLLNYLVALSYERNNINFDLKTTLNTIYKDLLEAVYERQWCDKGEFAVANHLKKSEFFRILEEIALTVWHGHGRTATQSAIFKRCKDSSLTSYLEKFSDGAEKGVVRLLTAFYFREFNKQSDGDRVFEFTHKSFGEYLTARRIVREVKNIQDEVKRHKKDPDKGYDIRKALEVWAKLCGKTAIDGYLFGFVRDEVSAYKKKEIKKWQKTFTEMLSSSVNHAMPMEKLGLESFEEMLKHSRNADKAILAIYNSCFKVTQKVIKTNFNENVNFGTWWKRLVGQDKGSSLSRKLLEGLSLESSNLAINDFYSVNFNESNLRHVNFFYSILMFSSFNNSNMERANLGNANLRRANLKGANLRGANLRGADLRGADLRGADLRGADLVGTNLKGASLKGANLEGANLEGANLEGANLEGANLEGANLEGANLEGANLKGTILEKKN